MSGILYSDISNHFITLTIIFAKYIKSQIEIQFFIHDMKNFNVEEFCLDLNSNLNNFLREKNIDQLVNSMKVS